MTGASDIASLLAENARLIALLESHGIEWRQPQSPAPVAREPEPSKLSTAQKVLFRRLYRGRTDAFDHPPLDTLVLTLPVSWKGTLQQYAGRLHREHAGKASVRIIDFVDTDHPALLRMWDKRQRGYRAMGYKDSQA
jgi:hypothetical protein